LRVLDTVDKTTGAQIYGMDLKLPGMVNAAIKDCPVFGGKIKSVDSAAVMKRPGVKKVVRVGDSAVAVVPTLGGMRRRRSMRFRSNGTTVRTQRRRARSSRKS
jgi:CO/xanthine dehydrogenase Mo-binding subunit